MRTAVLALLLAGCVDDGWSEVKLGTIYGLADGPYIDAPDSAAAGASIELTVYTGGGGCTSADHTDVDVTEDGADIFPYDKHFHPRNAKCTQEFRAIAHPIKLTFQTPSEKHLRLHGVSGHGIEEIPVEFPFAIHVE